MPLEPSESGSSGPDPGAPERDAVAAAPAPAGPSSEYRATATFLISGLFGLLALLFVGALSTATLPIRGVLLVGGVVLGAVAMLATAYGIANGRRWAIAVMVPMLLVVIAVGAVEVVWGLSHGTITLPIAAVLAIWALRAPIRTKLEPGPGATRWGVAGTLALGALTLGASAPVTSGALLTPGGPLVVASDALLGHLVVTCDESPGVPPTVVHVTYDWHWSRTEPLVAGNDTVTLEAFGLDDGGQFVYTFDSPAITGAGISQSDVMIGVPQGMVFGIDLSIARFDPGSVGLTFGRSAATQAGHGSIELRATYLHAPSDPYSRNSPAVWEVVSTARCEW